ncbi:MAG TPA: hypothetical protein VFQ27_09620 [Xanthobacteraceae bacterium]|nr:hypothetical protein [Xanthobacteraceae bacterium]
MIRRTVKVLAVPLAALALFGTVLASANDAQARHWRHRHHHHGVGLGIAAAIIGTAAIAAAASQPRCRTVAMVDRFGNVVGYREVC